MPARRVLLLLTLGTVALVAVVAIGLTQAGSKSPPPSQKSLTPAQQRARLAGAPAPLAALHAQAGELLDGAPATLHARLQELRGRPVVINKWASWCGPCRLEFPVFQRVSTQMGKQVAFIGLDGKDNVGDARTFLRQVPLSYPSYKDPDERAARELQAGAYYPTTVFIDRAGRRTVHQGPYNDDAALQQAIRRYALTGRA